MADLRAQIRSNADAIERLWRRIQETAARRDNSQADREAWATACRDFHQRFAELMYPGGPSRWQAMILRDSAELDTAIMFLEVNPRFFRSGYLREIIWSRLKRSPLQPRQERWLEEIAKAYVVHHKLQREFWYMVRYVRYRGSPSFWEFISALASSNAGEPSLKAGWLVSARRNLPIQSWVAREFRRAKYEAGYAPTLHFNERGA